LAPAATDLLPASPPGPVVVALSGGLDSTVLLHALAALPAYRHAGLRALHIHHGLHADADAWQAHCQALCAQWQVPLDVHRVEVPRDTGLGLEGAARAARRAVFAAALKDGEWLALAHHRDDQAETFLLRALRGSGPEGLAAMRPRTRFAAGHLWRPLLSQPRSALHAYAVAHQLRWIEDPANADLHHDRNFLRHQVLPLLRTRWPHADAALANSAALSEQASALLGTQEEDWLRAHADAGSASLDLPALCLQLPAQRARLLRHWVTRHGAPPLPARSIATIEGELLQADDGARYAWHGVEIRRWRNRLYLLGPQRAWPKDWQAIWDGRHALALPDGGELQLLGGTGFDVPLRVTGRRGGERLHLPGRSHSHQLKHLLQDAGMPPWQRFALPLLWDADTLLAAGADLHAARFAHWLHENNAALAWQPARPAELTDPAMPRTL